MNTFKQILSILAISATLATPAFAGNVTVKGSDTMVVLGQKWAETYMKTHAGQTVQVTGGGSGTGISALTNGTTDIAESSRSMKDAEKTAVQAKFNQPATEMVVARDGVTVYVHKSNPLNELTKDQIKQIYTGKVENWKQVGGPDAKITLYSRENNSGTYVFFKEHVLDNADYAVRAQTLPGTAAVVNAVARDKNGIGYGGAAYAKNIKALKIKKDATSAGVAPSAATVKDGSYALARALFFYTRGAPAGDVKAFIDWVLGAEGQKLVTEVGYFPVK
jgi:phosphate transport system substrate-binding protein